MGNYKRGAYAKTYISHCLWCGKEIQTKKGFEMKKRERRILEHIKKFVNKDEKILSFKKVRGKGVLPHYYIITDKGDLTMPLKWY